MGTVYEVERVSDGRHFAAKVLSVKPSYLAMARFAREAQLLARLQHPNLIAIVDVDISTDRLAYLVMEQVDGQSLEELHARYGERELMLSVLFQVAEALAAVHAAGVVHRDLKPGNVLIAFDANGLRATAKLVDFGISRLLEAEEGAAEPAPRPVSREARAADLSTRREDVTLPSSRGGRTAEQLTQAGSLMGTLFYMAPELRDGADLAQPPADVFSFGLMAYEVLTGVAPFETPALLLAAGPQGQLALKPLLETCPGLGAGLAGLLERCLAVDPGARPSPVELAAALRESSAQGKVVLTGDRAKSLRTNVDQLVD